MDNFTNATDSTEIQLQPPYDGWYGWAATILIFVCFIGVVLESLFIFGAWGLCGWNSNFAYILLVAMAFCGLQVHFSFIIATLLWIIVPSIIAPIAVRRLAGNLLYIPFLTTPLLNVVLTGHRFLFTLNTFNGSRWFPPIAAKITISLILIFHVITIIYLQFSTFTSNFFYTNLLYFGAYADKEETMNTELLDTLNEISNYMTGIFNLVAYPLLFLILYYRGKLTFKKNAELKMTMQVMVAVILELLLFIYWQIPASDNDWDMLIGIVSDLAYFSIILCPYLIFNRTLQRQIFCAKPNSVGRRGQISLVSVATKRSKSAASVA